MCMALSTKRSAEGISRIWGSPRQDARAKEKKNMPRCRAVDGHIRAVLGWVNPSAEHARLFQRDLHLELGGHSPFFAQERFILNRLNEPDAGLLGIPGVLVFFCGGGGAGGRVGQAISRRGNRSRRRTRERDRPRHFTAKGTEEPRAYANESDRSFVVGADDDDAAGKYTIHQRSSSLHVRLGTAPRSLSLPFSSRGPSPNFCWDRDYRRPWAPSTICPTVTLTIE